MNKKQNKNFVEIKRDSSWEFDGMVDDIINKLKSTKKELEKNGFTDIKVSVETEYGFYDDSWAVIVYSGIKK